MQPGHDPYAALRFADYRRLLAGNMLASIATEVQRVAVGWELLQRTGSALNLGLVGLVQFVPVFLLALPAGHVADRYRRQRVIMLAQGVMTVASFGLAWLAFIEGPVPLIYLCLLVTGVSQAFNSPARWALVPQVVPATALTNAITWNSSGFQIASVLGPALGGGMLALAGGQALGTFVLSGCCSLACAVLIATVRPRPATRFREPMSLHSLLAGIAFVRRSKLILATITLDLFAVLLGGAVALLPIFAEMLGVGPAGYGWLQAAPALGALGMALALAHRPPMRRAGPALLWAVTGFGAATIVFGLSTNFVLSFLMLALTGAFDNISVVVRGTLVQILTPDEMRGRVSAVNAIFISSSNQVGAFESGLTAHWFGVVPSVVGGGVGTILVVLVVLWLWPEVQRLGPLSPPPPETVAATDLNREQRPRVETAPEAPA